LETRHFGMDAEIQSPWTANLNTQRMINQAFAFSVSNRPWHWIPASLLE